MDNLNTKATSEMLAAVFFACIIYCEDRRKREWLGSKALAIVKVYMDNKKAAA